jgi:hypothetical protein
LTPSELRASSTNICGALRARADEQIKVALAGQFTAASSGVRKVVDELDLSGDGDSRRDTRAALLKASRARGVPREVAEKGLSLLTRSNGFGRVEDPLPPDVPLGRNPLIQNELAQARTILLGKMTRVGAPKIAALLDRGLTVETLNDDALDAMVNAGTLSDADAGRLGLAAAMLRLTDDLDVTDTLVRRRFATCVTARRRACATSPGSAAPPFARRRARAVPICRDVLRTRLRLLEESRNSLEAVHGQHERLVGRTSMNYLAPDDAVLRDKCLTFQELSRNALVAGNVSRRVKPIGSRSAWAA